jgi:hypothetical protein
MLDRLIEEINQDPLDRGYAQMSDAEVAESMNVRERPSSPEPVDRLALKDIAIMRSVWSRLVWASTMEDEAGFLALNIMAAFQHDGPAVNLQRPEVVAMLDAAVGTGLFTIEDRQAFEMLAASPISRATEIGWPQGVTERDIEVARIR